MTSTDRTANTAISIADQLEQAIKAGYYSSNCRFPSSRMLARQYCTSRSTVLVVLGMLSRKNLIAFTQGSAPKITYRSEPDLEHTLDFSCPDSQAKKIEHGADIFSWVPQCLPTRKWFSLISKATKTAVSSDLSTFENAALELKIVLRNYLARQRQIRCTTNQIFIFENSGVAVDFFSEILLPSKDDKILIDAPALPNSARHLARQSNSIESVNLGDLSSREVLAGLGEKKGRLLYITPSTRFGTCRSLRQDVRQEILSWADKEACHILEHDLGHEFCSGPSSHPAIFSLDDSSTVVYLADFQSSLSPLTDLCAAVVPLSLVDLANRKYVARLSSCMQLQYIALAELLKTGYLERHVKTISELSCRNLSQFQQLLLECGLAPLSVSLNLLKTGKEATLEIDKNANFIELEPALASGLLTPFSVLYGLDQRQKNLFLVSGDRLQGEDRALLLKCLAQATKNTPPTFQSHSFNLIRR